jgi:CrcB protein
MVYDLALVFLGSGIGGVLRYMFTAIFHARFSINFPLDILIVNIVGSFVIGVVATLLIDSGNKNVQNFLVIGLCGGYTTFSSFSLDNMKLIQSGNLEKAAVNIVASTVLCIAAVFLGSKMTRYI